MKPEPELLHYSLIDLQPLPFIAAWSAQGLCALYPVMQTVEKTMMELGSQFKGSRWQAAEETPDWMRSVTYALQDPQHPFPGPYDLRGTRFQQAVWQALATIPAGQTRSYQEIARQIGRPNAVRAVGSACGANPISVLIPCHRVIRSDGSYQGYHWGIEMKTRLLNKEAGLD